MRARVIQFFAGAGVVFGMATWGAEEVKDPNPPAEMFSPVSFNLPKATGGPDAFGYTFRDQSEAGVNFTFVDISGSGTEVIPGDPNDLGPADDALASVPLGAPFTFYGVEYTDMFISTNGWISAGPTTEVNFVDISNDCPLPAVPHGGGARIAVLHDDLVATGGCFYEFFPVAPILGHDPAQIAQPASIFMWNDARHFGGAGTWDIEVVLFHTTGEIFCMIGPGNPELGSGSTTGLQNRAANVGITYACNTANSIPDSTAVAFLLGGGAVNVPFFRDTPTVPGFIGLKNVSFTDLTLEIVYTQVEDVGGGVFEPVDQAPQNFPIAANAQVSWRPVQDDASEGAGQAVPNTSTTDGSTPSAGSARISWLAGGTQAIQGRYVEQPSIEGFSYLLPPAIDDGGGTATLNVPFFRDSPTVPGFIGIRNTTGTDLTLTIVYTQVEDVGGGVFEPVDQAPQNHVIPANSSLSWRPVQDDPGEGIGQAVPNTSTTDGSTPAAGSARMSWAQGGLGAIQGRYVESPGSSAFSYLIPKR